MATATTHFDLVKGNRFSLDKGIRRVRTGLGWDAGFDLDASVFGLVHLSGGKPVFYGGGTHAVCYANSALKLPDGTIPTQDGSIIHSGDNRTGAGDGDDEVITIDFTKLPSPIVELAVWVTIYEPAQKHETFGEVKNSYITVTDADTNQALCQYKLREEFATATAVQVGSFVKSDQGIWSFTAIGAGSPNTLRAVLDQYA